MTPILYSHRLKSVLTHTVRDLGLNLSINDANTNLSLKDNEAVLRETAEAMGLKLHLEKDGDGTTAVFFK